jgi:hypothetical protein
MQITLAGSRTSLARVSREPAAFPLRPVSVRFLQDHASL